MNLRNDVQWLTGAVVTTLLCTGCTLSSNDAWQAVQAPEPSVQFEPGSSPTSPFPIDDLVTFNSYSAGGMNRGNLRLYGQLPDRGPGRSSPLDGGPNLRQVSFSTEGGDFDPDIDPTGTWMVHASTRHRHTSDIYLARIGGSAVTQLTSDPANDEMPSFSPDGKRIAFASDRAGNWDIYIMDVDGGQAVQVTSDASHQIHPSYSPDGKQLAFSSFGQQSGQWEMVVVATDNPATKRFIGFGLFPRWSPIDNRLVFQRARQRGTRWFSIWTVDIVAGQATQPTEIIASSNAAAVTPNWSPDGQQIVFCTVIDPQEDDQSRPVHADVWITSRNGTGRAKLTSSQYASLQPVWSPDGTVYFVSDRAGLENVWALRPDSALKLGQPSEGNRTAAAPIRLGQQLSPAALTSKDAPPVKADPGTPPAVRPVPADALSSAEATVDGSEELLGAVETNTAAEAEPVAMAPTP